MHALRAISLCSIERLFTSTCAQPSQVLHQVRRRCSLSPASCSQRQTEARPVGKRSGWSIIPVQERQGQTPWSFATRVVLSWSYRCSADAQPMFSQCSANDHPMFSRCRADVKPMFSQCSADVQPLLGRGSADVQPT